MLYLAPRVIYHNEGQAYKSWAASLCCDKHLVLQTSPLEWLRRTCTVIENRTSKVEGMCAYTLVGESGCNQEHMNLLSSITTVILNPCKSRKEDMKLFTGITDSNIPGAPHLKMNGRIVHVTTQMVSEAQMDTPRFLSMHYAM